MQTLLERMAANTALQKLDAMARAQLGGGLHVLLCQGDQVDRLPLSGAGEHLPEFCRVIRETEGGEDRCGVCRWLMAIRACHKGVTDYCCHGGISVVSAPAVVPKGKDGEFVVVGSCGFATAEREDGWEAARDHAEGLDIEETALKRAYFSLPVMAEEKLPLARAIVDTAASIVAQLVPEGGDGPGVLLDQPDEAAAENAVRQALAKARQNAAPGQKPCGSALVDVVKAIIGRNPAMPFTAANVAKAAQMSPNHFSSVFHQHTGQTFKDFLTEQRIALAQDLLGDLRLTVGDVAFRAGFQDAAYFSRRFKAVTGKSPRDWREQRGAHVL
ncbi:MAG: helix-turn-helix domain-containing protein [Candidatus Hydrogenedentes bacterium]|nr:helix-turn-helix domain-containing protein [Candidatus Hydrogenedentota bacterium]